MLGKDPTPEEIARWFRLAVAFTVFGLGLIVLSYRPPEIIRLAAWGPLSIAFLFACCVLLGWNARRKRSKP